MAETQYTTIRVHEDVRNDARVMKAKLGVDWNEFLRRAIQSLNEETHN